MLKWAKAGHGGTTSKSGGGKRQWVGTEGDKGIPSGGTYPSKAEVSKKRGIDSPSVSGNKGVDTQKGFPSAKAPKSE